MTSRSLATEKKWGRRNRKEVLRPKRSPATPLDLQASRTRPHHRSSAVVPILVKNTHHARDLPKARRSSHTRTQHSYFPFVLAGRPSKYKYSRSTSPRILAHEPLNLGRLRIDRGGFQKGASLQHAAKRPAFRPSSPSWARLYFLCSNGGRLTYLATEESEVISCAIRRSGLIPWLS